jgi:hypothetical protein
MRQLVLLVIAGASLQAAAAQPIPACRLDDSHKPIVLDTVTRSAATYQILGKALPFDAVAVNPGGPTPERTLTVFIVKDANEGDLTPQACARAATRKDAPLDSLSVLGGCAVVDPLQIRCSADAVRLFADVHEVGRPAGPGLLYILAHELGHVRQQSVGDYSGRTETIDLKQDRARKLKALQDACDPVSTRRESEADAWALEVMLHALPKPPYREPALSERGSLYWNIDKLALVTAAWQQSSLEREFMSRPAVHRAFQPSEFPTPPGKVEANAKRFVCDVLGKSTGRISYPGKLVSHPPLEQRLRRIAEALEPAAKRLPAMGGSREFAPVSRLQGDLSPIFTHIYRETGAYMEAVQAQICTVVNAPQAPTCK